MTAPDLSTSGGGVNAGAAPAKDTLKAETHLRSAGVPALPPAPTCPAVVEGEAATAGQHRINHGTVDPGAEDMLRATRLVIAIGGDDTDVHTLRIDGDPWSKSRPRHTRTGVTYTAPEDRAAESRTRRILTDALLQPMTGNVAMAAIFYRSNRQRIDADNLLKHVCDSATGPVWEDDCQVTAIVGVIELDADYPRTVVAFAPHDSTLTRGTDWTQDCGWCGNPFLVNSNQPKKKYCGPVCSQRGRGGQDLTVPIPCRQCGEPFRRTTTAQVMCSPGCRVASIRGRNKARASDRPFSTCATCGAPLAHRRGGRCRSCWLAAPADRPVTA